ncbi:MAG TPA: nuclear transport factor 2 family protein [Nitrolancea sp.]|nr:nuclear transport factor 2 family protein [Nitrolancea sp.]
MPALTPQETELQFGAYFNAADLDSLLTLYESDAKLVAQPGQVVAGIDQIRQALQGLLALHGRIQLTPQLTIEAGDIALVLSRWELKGTGPDGQPLELQGQTSDVLHRHADGHWLFAIDNPWGAAATGG